MSDASMKSERTIRVSDLRRDANRLVATDKMPTFDQLLTVVTDVRTKYTPAIKKAQERKS